MKTLALMCAVLLLPVSGIAATPSHQILVWSGTHTPNQKVHATFYARALKAHSGIGDVQVEMGGENTSKTWLAGVKGLSYDVPTGELNYRSPRGDVVTCAISHVAKGKLALAWRIGSMKPDPLEETGKCVLTVSSQPDLNSKDYFGAYKRYRVKVTLGVY